jgi:hypothetical protein
MSQTWYIALFAFSLFNFPIFSFGDKFIGVFDPLILLTFLYVIFTRFKYKQPPKFLFIQLVIASLILISMLLNCFYKPIVVNDILYIIKLFSFSIIPILVVELLQIKSNKIDIEKIERSLLICGLFLLIYSIYEAHLIYGMTRSGVPFSYGSSGPLGLVALGFCFYFFIFPNSKRKLLFFAIGISLLFASFSKSFILSLSLLVIYQIKTFINFKTVLIFMFTIIAGSIYVFDDLIYISQSLTNFTEMSTIVERLDNHWFEYWDVFFHDGNYLIGIGKQNIDIALDSAYFYLFYNIGFVGCVVLLPFFLWVIKNDKISNFYIISLLSSGLFLETMIVSPRGMEPFTLLLSFYFLKAKALK